MLNIYDSNNKKALHSFKSFLFTKEKKEKIITYVETTIFSFIKSNYYIIRKITHIGQSLSVEATDKAIYFLREVIKKEKYLNMIYHV